MALSSEGYFPKKDWFDALPTSKTQHKDVIASDEDARREGDISLLFLSEEGADEVLGMYVDALSRDQNPELTMPVSQARELIEQHPEITGAPAVAAAVEYPDQQAA